MALRLRRSLLLSSSLLKNRSFSAIPSSPSPLLKPSPLSPPARRDSSNPQLPTHFRIQSLSFRSSSASSSSSRFNDRDDGKISPDTILFEGCDYNHWLITMDFPKDPKPTPEEMVETYVQTLAKVVGSVEEAKKRMYACSTTTYNGFQAVMTEEMSEKFRGLPGVVFILPDSYIDPVNKEYGGDKYINGTIIPRPPPVQYGGRQGRFDDRNRRPRDRNTSYDRPSAMQGDGRNYAPQQNYGQPGQDGRGYGPPPSRDFNPSMERGNASYDRQGSMQGDGRNYVPQQNYGQTGQGGYGPPASRDFNPNMERGNFGQGERRDYGQAGGRDYNQGQQGNYVPQGGRRDYVPPEHAGFRENSYQDAGPSGNVDYRQGSGTDQGRY